MFHTRLGRESKPSAKIILAKEFGGMQKTDWGNPRANSAQSGLGLTSATRSP
jgi:hypothetical protein